MISGGSSWLTITSKNGDFVNIFMPMVLAEQMARQFNRAMTPAVVTPISEPFKSATRDELIHTAAMRGHKEPEKWADLMLISRAEAPDEIDFDGAPEALTAVDWVAELPMKEAGSDTYRYERNTSLPDFDDGNITDGEQS